MVFPVIFFICFILPTHLLHAQEVGLKLKPVAAWNVVFAGSEATYQFAINGPMPHPAKASWSLTANNRTIARGEVQVESKNGQAELSIPLRFPETRPGIRVPLRLQLEAVAAGKTVSLDYQIILFAEDAFADNQQWLEKLQIVLYDPVGKTADVFDQAKIPYKFLRTTAGIDAQADLVVVGEGVSLETDRGLAESLIRKASEGARILFLAPAEGQISVPGSSESDLPRPERISLRGPDVIADLDKQLVGQWAPGGKPQLATFQFQTDRNLTIWRVTSPGVGWVWIDIDYENSNGRLIFCGLGLIDRWEAGPGPRYLLAALLNGLKGDPTPKSSEE